MTGRCICRNGSTLGYVLFTGGGSNLPVVTKGLHSPTKVSRSIPCLWLHHNCINKDRGSQGQRLQLEAVSEVSLLSAVFRCKQRGRLDLLMPFPAFEHATPIVLEPPGKSLCGWQ